MNRGNNDFDLSALDRMRILQELIGSLRRNAFNEYDMNVKEITITVRLRLRLITIKVRCFGSI